ncbi:MAG: 3-deoxy-8-phosphooctulonate synthase [Kiritimatiellia bacterium]|nr:3-deoxy-8-phosphooctulonate synthase [Lentisphaerota bacterium]
MRTVRIAGLPVGGHHPLVLIAGPCVIEGRQQCLQTAGRLARLAQSERIPLIFKASYDKANRSSHQSFRGPGLVRGLEILREVKERFGLPVMTDVHNDTDVPLVAQVADVLQCPAFLCRQTDLILALGHSGKPVNIKKAQFLAPWDMAQVVAKLESTGNRRILLTERGTTMGYNNLVADMRSLLVMRELGYPVVFDATHSVQLPGKAGDKSGGDARWAGPLAQGAVAVGCDAVFIETHPAPTRALSDAATMLPLSRLKLLWRKLRAIDKIISEI